MIINGRVSYIENGFATSIRAMQVQSELVSMTNQNIIGFDKIGYQRQEPVISSFTEMVRMFQQVNGILRSIPISMTERQANKAMPVPSSIRTLP